MPNRVTILASAVVAALTFTASMGTGQAREYHSRSQALHHLRHYSDRDIYDYSRRAVEPEGPIAGPTRNWYGPGEYDRLTNGSDASTPGHN